MDYTNTLPLNYADVLREKQRVSDLLRIPIGNLAFSRFFCEIFLNQHSIGFLPITLSSEGVKYDSSKASLSKINWNKVFAIHQDELARLLRAELQMDLIQLIPTSFRRVYVEDHNSQLIASFECIYENFKWSVFDEGILAKSDTSKSNGKIA